MSIMFGSARMGENGKTTGGKPGDQTGKEVSSQPMYTHSLGWYILRPKIISVANKLAEGMRVAIANENIGYNQNERLGVIKNGVNSKVKTNADCSSLTRACCIYAGFDPGNFTTDTAVRILEATGKFEKRIAYVSQAKTPVYDGDILVTKTKGHIGIIISGSSRFKFTYGGVNYEPVFDYIYYAEHQNDVKNAFGTDPIKLFNHFIAYGMREGRQACKDFNVAIYKSRYSDLQNVFKDNLPLYYKHFCEFGKSEGRRGV